MSATVLDHSLVDDFETLWNTSSDTTRTRSLVPISTGSGTPIFCVHWGSGNIRFVRRTSGEWSAGRPVFGFEAVGLHDAARPLVSVAEMADRYVREMRAAAPRGPYALVGLCSGAQIAFEMAQRLAAAGEAVELLAVVNGVCPGVQVFNPRWALRDIYDLRLASLRRDFNADDLDLHLPRVLSSLKRQHWIDEHAEREHFYRHQLVWAASAYAQEHYAATTYDGPIHVFRSADARGPGEVPWDRVGSNVITRVVPALDSPAAMRDPAFTRLFSRLDDGS
ncbi:thioesterase domain-containing protein [Saccharopolyspora sp. 5N708]|uniref:thioesterase domain-containing protein n=1 Tax=Saccharopolyspora sp. 5N708 TaxID=3457424 RepID=UPI003FD67032